MIITSDATGTEFLRARIDEAKLLLPGLLVDTAQIAGDAITEELSNAAPVGVVHSPSRSSSRTGRPASSLSVAGAGTGLINPPLASTAIGVVAPQRAGMASGINSTFRQVGIAHQPIQMSDQRGVMALD